MDSLQKLVEDIIINEKKCINEISNIKYDKCSRCPYGYLDSSLRFSCSIKQLITDVEDVKRRTKILMQNNDNAKVLIEFKLSDN